MFLQSLKLTNLLSFGPEGEAFPLRPLNVLVGPNGSGKSNLIEAISLLQAAPREISSPIYAGGGVSEWIWKGGTDRASSATIEAELRNRETLQTLRHRVVFGEVSHRLDLRDERIESVEADPTAEPFVYFRSDPTPILQRHSSPTSISQRRLSSENLSPQRSILAQFKDPELYAEMDFVGEAYGDIALYRHWTFGHRAPARSPQPVDLRSERLEEDGRNLGLILNRYRLEPKTKRALVEAMKLVWDGIVDFSVKIEGGTVQVFLEEVHGWSTPATRLSDGTMRWLWMLAVLLDPKPPRLVCIEEPELGLHPDLIPKLADLLKQASTRMQLVVTTHSEVLVDALTESPEDIVICERIDGSTRLRRLEAEALAKWLEDYRLGQLWSKGVLGGNRW